MAERAIWTGSISFGLVDIPVALQSAEVTTDLDFDLVDRRDMAPIGYRKINKNTGEEVPADEIIRVIESRHGKMVALSDEEIRKAHPESTKRIEVRRFVEPSTIDAMYFARPYYLRPGKTAGKSYVLLREVLRRTGKVGIATIVLRTRQHTGALMPHGDVLMLDLLRFQHEIRAPGSVPATGVKLTKAEIDIAERLVEGMAGKWDPEEYTDEYRDKILVLVEQKAKTGRVEVVEEPRERPKGRIIDLMALLQQSIEQTKTPGRRTSRRTARKKATRASPARRRKTG